MHWLDSCPNLPGTETGPGTWDFQCWNQENPRQSGMSCYLREQFGLNSSFLPLSTTLLPWPHYGQCVPLFLDFGFGRVTCLGRSRVLLLSLTGFACFWSLSCVSSAEMLSAHGAMSRAEALPQVLRWEAEPRRVLPRSVEPGSQPRCEWKMLLWRHWDLCCLSPGVIAMKANWYGW